MRTTQLIKHCLIATALSISTVAVAQATKPAATAPAAPPPHDPVAFTPIPHVEVRGTGPIAMVLIPGLSCDWTVFDAFMNRNADRYTMYAVTLPGFGGSDSPPAPPAGQFGAWLDNAAAAVWKVVEEKKLEKPVIAGHSLGGHLALRIGAEHANHIRAAIAIDGAPAFPYLPATSPGAQRLDVARQMAGAFDAMTDEQWVANQQQMVTSMVTDPDRARQLVDLCTKVPRAATIQYFADLMAADIRDQLPKLNAPTLVMASAMTSNPGAIKTIRQTWMDLLQSAPKLTFIVFENTRHFIQDDRPAELDAAIADFLAGREVKGFTAPPASRPATTKPATQPRQ